MTVGKGYQFMSLDENKPLPSCIDGKKGKVWSQAFKPSIVQRPDGKPVYCEGLYTTKKCFTYFSNNDTWLVTGQLPEVMQHMVSDYSPEVGLVVAGGNKDGGRGNNLDSVYRSWDYGYQWEALPKLPNRIEAGCLLILNNDEIVHLGGRDTGHRKLKNVWSFKFSTNTWTAKADMIEGGNTIACQVVKREDGEREIVAVGEANNRVEIYNIAANTWRLGNNFPTRSMGAASAKYGDSLLIVGGYDHSQPSAQHGRYVDTVYEYNVKSDNWTLLPQRLDKAPNENTMNWLSAIVLDDSICD